MSHAAIGFETFQRPPTHFVNEINRPTFFISIAIYAFHRARLKKDVVVCDAWSIQLKAGKNNANYKNRIGYESRTRYKSQSPN